MQRRLGEQTLLAAVDQPPVPRQLALIVVPVVVVIALATAVGLSLGADSSDAAEVDAMTAMTSGSARTLIEDDAVVPALRPPYLSTVLAHRRVSDDRLTHVGNETSYQHGSLQVFVCETAASSVTTSCDAADFWSVMREETHDGRVVRVAVKPGWNIPRSPADVPPGDRIAAVLWWWATVPLERGTEPPWLTEAASQPSLEELAAS